MTQRNGHAGEHTNGHTAAPQAPVALRVITVGRTGLEAALRRDPRVELVRARSALEAIGELGDPIDAASPQDAVLLLGDGAHRPGDGPRFIAAARVVDPAVRIVAVGGHAASLADGFDAVLPPGPDAAVLWQAMSGSAPAAPAMPPCAIPPRPPAVVPSAPPRRPAAPREPALTTPLAPADPSDAAANAGAADSDATLGELALAQALLTGRDIVPVAMHELRRRAGGRTLVFLPGGAAAPANPPGPTAAAGLPAPPFELASCAQVVVRHNAHEFGRLCIDADAAPPELERWAQWLAHWLAVAAQHAELRQAALVDDLTGAWNRRYFDRFIAAALNKAQRDRETVTVLVLDIDNFKYFNDAHGHAAGDQILRQTVEMLKSSVRSHDKVCRLGGDELAVIFHQPEGPRTPGSKPPVDIWPVVQRFQRRIADACFPELGEHAPGRLTVSGGIATYPWDGRTAAELLAHADRLALDCKCEGKNKITMGPRGGPAGETRSTR